MCVYKLGQSESGGGGMRLNSGSRVCVQLLKAEKGTFHLQRSVFLLLLLPDLDLRKMEILLPGAFILKSRIGRSYEYNAEEGAMGGFMPPRGQTLAIKGQTNSYITWREI